MTNWPNAGDIAFIVWSLVMLLLGILIGDAQSKRRQK
jgi:hypothetical protein